MDVPLEKPDGIGEGARAAGDIALARLMRNSLRKLGRPVPEWVEELASRPLTQDEFVNRVSQSLQDSGDAPECIAEVAQATRTESQVALDEQVAAIVARPRRHALWWFARSRKVPAQHRAVKPEEAVIHVPNIHARESWGDDDGPGDAHVPPQAVRAYVHLQQAEALMAVGAEDEAHAVEHVQEAQRELIDLGAAEERVSRP